MRVIPTLAFLVIAATIGFAAGCGDDDDEDTAGGGGGATQVSMTEYAFEPKDLTVSQGDTITAKNDGQIPHNYSIEGGKEIGEIPPPSTQNVDPGTDGTLTVDVSRGTYGVICTIPGHAEKGMKGTLPVE